MFGFSPDMRAEKAPPLPPDRLYEADPEAYWARLRKEQFLLPEWRAFLNTGSLGVAARPVLTAAVDYLNRSAALEVPEHGLPRWGGEPFHEMRQELADFFGCHKDELAFTHNTTEGMNTVCNGLDLKPGDEVLLTNQEHPGGTNCWLQKEARFGIRVRRVPLEIPPRGPGQIVDTIRAAIGPQTRVLSFAGITTQTGLRMPIRDICEVARAKGVLSVVDGAHLNGQVPVNLHEWGCDFLAGSPHKWMLTPTGCGILYIREEMLDRLWVNVATTGWNDRSLKAVRFQMVGTNNRAVLEGHLAALRMLKQIGPDRVYGRIHQLAQQVRRRAAELPNARMLTPDDDRMYGGMVTFEISGFGKSRFWELARQRRMWVVGSDRVRISTHIHTRPADLDLLFATLKESLG